MRRYLLLLVVAAFALPASAEQWIGTWGAAPQPFIPGALRTYRNQTLRLIVHTTAGGTAARVRISNLYSDQPLIIGAAQMARRTTGAEIDAATDAALTFGGKSSVTIPSGSAATSDGIRFDVPPLSDIAISLYFPQIAAAKTTHILAKQTSYVSTEGDRTRDPGFPVASTIHNWPFLTGVDVLVPQGATIVAFGSSLTDGDGTTPDQNKRYPNALAERLQQSGRRNIGVLNEGIIGNRLLRDSPEKMKDLFGASLGESGLKRFDRDVLSQPGVQYVIVGLGVNDIMMPGEMSPATEVVTAQNIIDAYRELVRRAHRKGVRVIGSTLPGFEDSFFKDPPMHFYTSEKEVVRERVNDWILHGHEFDAVVDFDAVVRDPDDPKRIRADYDSGDHLHPNDAGSIAQANAIPLEIFSALLRRAPER